MLKVRASLEFQKEVWNLELRYPPSYCFHHFCRLFLARLHLRSRALQEDYS